MNSGPPSVSGAQSNGGMNPLTSPVHPAMSYHQAHSTPVPGLDSQTTSARPAMQNRGLSMRAQNSAFPLAKIFDYSHPPPPHPPLGPHPLFPLLEYLVHSAGDMSDEEFASLENMVQGMYESSEFYTVQFRNLLHRIRCSHRNRNTAQA